MPTPALLVDLDRLERNLTSWQRTLDASGVLFRPHVKTHKTVELTLRQQRLGAAGIVCAKVSEAEALAGAGVDDVVVAFPVLEEDACERLAALAATGTTAAVNLDSELAARRLSVAAEGAGARLGVQLDVDTGLGRGGRGADELDELTRLGELVHDLPGLELEGVTTYRGIRGRSAAATLDACGQEEGELLVSLAERLRGRGIAIEKTTAGSTPTGRAAARVPGVTEIRAGTYVFNDLMQVEAGSATEADLALGIMCTVVSVGRTRATVDGGSKTFGGDAIVRDGDGSAYARAADREASIAWLNEEHGVVVEGAESLALGERVLWYPAHVCTCVNLSDELLGVRDGIVEEVWPVVARGRRT